MSVPNPPYESRILRRNGETWPRVSNPPAWAQHRQEMTDALIWFKQTQGGVNMTRQHDPNGHYVTGILLGGFGAERSYIDAEVIITSLNGDRDNTPTSHTTQARSVAMRNTIRDAKAVGVIFERGLAEPMERTGVKRSRDGQAPLLPCSGMPTGGATRQNCWVADWFLPTFMWPTKLTSAEGTVWMVRLEKWHLERQSWWANAQHGIPPSNTTRNYNIRAAQETCSICGKTSPRIYEEMFVCVNDSCANVWRHNGQIISSSTTLTYTDEFLQERILKTTNPASSLLNDFNTWWTTDYWTPINTNQPLTDQNFKDRINVLLRGFVCPYCGMMNRRRRWHEWHCRNSRCSNGTNAFHIKGCPPPITVQQAKTLGTVAWDISTLKQNLAYRSSHETADFVVDEFVLGDGCSVAYLQPKPHTNGSPGSSDDLYMRIQKLAADGTIPLERRSMNTAAGASLTSHFAANYGETYLYSARVPTTPFTDAPPVIREAVSLVNNWVAPWRTASDHPANELYLAGYLESQKMSWHGDGEVGLGNIVTTYTLGGQGTFRFRITPKYQSGFTGGKTNPISHDPVIPGCAAETERRALRNRLDTGQISHAQWQQEFTNLMRPRNTTPRRLLELPVNHGCIVIMYGPNTQTYLEHSVDVATPMRFALTFRHIQSHHATPQQRSQLKTRLAYDVEFDPGTDWAQPHFLSPGNSREGSPDPLPALSPRDNPPSPDQMQQLDTPSATADDAVMSDAAAVLTPPRSTRSRSQVATTGAMVTRSARGGARGGRRTANTSASSVAVDSSANSSATGGTDDGADLSTGRRTRRRTRAHPGDEGQ